MNEEHGYSSSWLNAVERWFAQLERRSLYRGIFSSVPDLNEEIKRCIEVHNRETTKRFKLTKDAKSIFAADERQKMHYLTNRMDH